MEIKDYRRIVNELIEESFLKLKSRIIFLSKGKIPFMDYFAAVVYFIFFSWIIVHPKMDNLPKNEVKAVLAHELAHLSILSNMNLIQKIKFGICWIFTKKGKKDFERDADLLAIKRGYGEGLLKRVNCIEKEYNKEKLKRRKIKGYLGSEEIKKYINKFN